MPALDPKFDVVKAAWLPAARRAAPARLASCALAVLALCAASLPAGAAQMTEPLQTAQAPTLAQDAAAAAAIQSSSLDAPLFYQLIIGELELSSGEPGTAFQVLLDAAQRTKDEQVFRRAVDIALKARAGDQALSAVRAWRTAIPTSLEAHRYLVQMLVALNRGSETVEPLRSLLALSPPAERSALILSLPRLFAREKDPVAAATLLQDGLEPSMQDPVTQTAATLAVGRGWLTAKDYPRSLTFAKRAQALDPAGQGPALLALELLSNTPDAEPLVASYLASPKPDAVDAAQDLRIRNAIRMVYARVLAGAQRFGDAITQIEAVTRTEPQLPSPWLSLGALNLELKQTKPAEAALTQYLKLAQAPDRESAAPSDENTATVSDSEDDEAQSPEQGVTQAYLLLAQAAEQRNDFKAAEAWLAKVDNPQRALEVQARRASLLARQGRMADARELIRKAPERSPADARAKLLTEAQLLRDAKDWQGTHDVLAQANEKFPNDVDLLYEQSMMSEKLGQYDEMETLLRRVIAIKPDHHHAYNALGYSLAERNVRLPEARDLIRKALDLMPGEPFITDSLGWVEYRMGKLDESLRLLRQAYQSRPDTEIAAHLGEVLWAAGQQDEARKVWTEGRNKDSSNDVLKET
ncbi:MAG: hypothetical protein JWP52_2626, partial [Rhizobacter sp.]|nr:hypothetical protein [Rhizobacter sp.]